MQAMVNVCDCYRPPFPALDRIADQLDKLYNTELLFGEKRFKYDLHFSLAMFQPCGNLKH